MSLIHWWPLTGTLKDMGTHNFTLGTNASTAAAGKIGSCYTLNGSTALWAKTAETVTFPLTLSAWIYPTNVSSSNTQYIFSYNTGTGGTSGHLFGFGLYGTAQLTVWYRGTNIGTGINLSNNTWYHIGVTMTADFQCHVYINGELRYSFQNSGSGAPASQWWTIGARCDSATGGAGGRAYYFSGMVNDFRIYDEALSADAIHEIAQGLMMHYPLDGNGCGNVLPAEYQRVQYLRSKDVTTYIDTGIKLSTFKIEYKGRFISRTGTETSLFSCFGESNRFFNCFVNSYASTVNFYKGNEYAGLFAYDSGVHTITVKRPDATNFQVLVDGESKVKSTSTYTSNAINLKIFARGDLNSDYSNGSSQCYSFKVWGEKDNPLFDGVPCYRKSDGKPGMYDRITNTFFVSAGNTDFLLGPTVANLPIEYQQVEYIRDVYNCTFNTQLTTDQVSTIQHIIQWPATSGRRLMGFDGNGGYWGIKDGYYEKYTVSSVPASTTDYDHISLNSNGFYVNYTNTGLGNIGPVAGGKYSLFNITGLTNYPCYCRMYTFRTFKTAVTSDMIPCYRKRNYAVGFYDIVRKQFYSISSGPVAGPAVGIPKRYNQLEYLYTNSTMGAVTIQVPALKGSLSVFGEGQYLSFVSNRDGLLGRSGTESPRIYYYSDSNTVGTGSSPEYQIGAFINKSRVYYRVSSNMDDTVSHAIYLLSMYGNSHTTNIRTWFYRFMDMGRNRIFAEYLPCIDTVTHQIGYYELYAGQFITADRGASMYSAGPCSGWKSADIDQMGEKEYDISGLSQPLVPINRDTIMYSSNTIRYNNCTYLNGNYGLQGSNFHVRDLSAVSFGGWFYRSNWNTPSTDLHLISQADAGALSFNIMYNASGLGLKTAVFKPTSAGSTSTVYWQRGLEGSSTSLSAGWHHLFTTWDNSSIKFYVDGQLKFTDTTTSTFTISAANNLRVGGSGTGNNLTGMMSDVRVYATCLSAADIHALFMQRNDNNI